MFFEWRQGSVCACVVVGVTMVNAELSTDMVCCGSTQEKVEREKTVHRCVKCVFVCMGVCVTEHLKKFNNNKKSFI